ncbi:hypothetical protein COV13_03005 [Candidatus Woesearchaeota archaeon CG10_big_fil_rev_8_21_14_0_10_32_9]|nr:MAG: hypothetical protein COV13_03005 [Candidatus Woesearchaeota archaeon CG10_big_fil_rev_8_21_14_0_10_32_9]
MDFSIHKRTSHSKSNYSSETINIAYKFAKEIHAELKELLKGIVLFGSAARKKEGVNDIDLLLIVDDVTIRLTPEMTQAYRLIVEQTVEKVSDKIHVTSMKFTSFWEYVRAGDPIAVNILRDGYALIDTGFFDPLQVMLKQGRIRPSPEALWAYFNRAPRTLENSRNRLIDSCYDLYWAVIDSAHAALMSINEVPPSPEHVADVLEEKLIRPKLLEKKYSATMRKFYGLSKDLASKKKTYVSGEEFDKLYDEAKEFVETMEKFIRK